MTYLDPLDITHLCFSINLGDLETKYRWYIIGASNSLRTDFSVPSTEILFVLNLVVDNSKNNR